MSENISRFTNAKETGGPDRLAEEFDTTEWNNVHRRFMQAMLAAGSLRVREAAKVVRDCLNAEGYSGVDDLSEDLTKAHLRGVVELANARINPIHLELKLKYAETAPGIKKWQYCVLINKLDNELTRANSIYTANEMEWLKVAMKALSSSETGSIGEIQAMNLVEQVEESKRIKRNQVDVLIKKLKNAKWLEDVGEGQIRATTRAIAELDLYIRNYLQLEDCQVCKEVVFYKKGQECPECSARFHKCCLGIDAQQQVKCPRGECRTVLIVANPKK